MAFFEQIFDLLNDSIVVEKRICQKDGEFFCYEADKVEFRHGETHLIFACKGKKLGQDDNDDLRKEIRFVLNAWSKKNKIKLPLTAGIGWVANVNGFSLPVSGTTKFLLNEETKNKEMEKVSLVLVNQDGTTKTLGKMQIFIC